MKVYINESFCLKCMDASSILAFSGFILILTGIALIFIAFIKLLLRPEKLGEAHSGGAVFIGPFPIIFGTDRKIIETLLIACIIIYLVVIMCMLAFGFLKFKVV